MKQYMSKTHENYGSGVARPKINDKTHFELKGQFLKELRENTFSGSKLEDANEHIEKVLIVDLFHIPEEVILFYNGLDVPTRQILDSKGAIPNKTVADAKVAIQEMAEYSRKWHYGTSLKTRSTETSDGLAIGQMSKVLQERGIGSLPSSTEPNPKDHVKSISTAKAHSTRIRRIRVGEEKLVFKSIKPPTSIIRRVYMLKEGMNLDSKFELIGKAVNESFDPHYGFSIIDDVDETSGVVLALPFCKKFVSCQKIIDRFTHGNECERMNDEE
nr:hypothetical protein [Tanacetum cinerariifolium]